MIDSYHLTKVMLRKKLRGDSINQFTMWLGEDAKQKRFEIMSGRRRDNVTVQTGKDDAEGLQI